MEHIVQFGIGIDDESIKKRVEETAEKQIIKDLEQEVRNKLFSSSWYGANAKVGDPLSSYSERLIEGFLEKNKKEIVDKAAELLAAKLIRTKAAKEALSIALSKE